MTDDLVKRLRDLGDRAGYEPHMHHTAADCIEELEAKLSKSEALLAKAVMALHEAESAPAPDHHVPQFQHVMDIIGATFVELKGETYAD